MTMILPGLPVVAEPNAVKNRPVQMMEHVEDKQDWV
jgi:hypothetical protein